jgi:hypothetical protein
MTGQAAPAVTANSGSPELTDEDRSKDKFYNEVAALANAMIGAHGRDFAMGTLVLAARFIADGKALSTPTADAARSGNASNGAARNTEQDVRRTPVSSDTQKQS